jgi:perosamine synthetase
MSASIPMSSADIDESDISGVVEVLRSGRLSLGPKLEEFEQIMANTIGVPYAVAVSSGTAALHLCVRALGLGPGDEVLVPSFSFAASVNVLLFEGVTPVFVDIEPETYNLDVRDLAAKVTRRTKAIMAVDLFGHPVEWDELLCVAKTHDLRIIDDACEALGAEYRGRKVGQFGDAATFAFYPNKQITTGEGGMIVTHSQEIARLARSLRNQGRGEISAWLEHDHMGYNYRMDEMSAALGVSQMQRLEEFLARRDAVARIYTERLRCLDWVQPPSVRPHVRMSWFAYVVILSEEWDRGDVMRALAAKEISTRAYFSPLHQQAYIRDCQKIAPAHLPVTEGLAQRTLALPFHNRLTEQEVERVVAALAACVGCARWTVDRPIRVTRAAHA